MRDCIKIATQGIYKSKSKTTYLRGGKNVCRMLIK